MKQNILMFVAFCSLVFVTSCSSTKYLSIDVRQPAKLTFAKDIVNVGIVDNAGVVLSDEDVEEALTASTDEQMSAIISQSRKAFLGSLVQFMNEEKFFNQVSLYSTATRTDKRFDALVPLSKSDISDIAKEMHVDAIITLDKLNSNSSPIKINLNGFLYSTYKGSTEVMLRTYNAEGKALSPLISVSDSIYWDENTPKKEIKAYEELALSLSEGTTRLIIPYWETQERFIYTDGTKLMKEAYKYVEKKEWADAAKVWGAAFDAETKNVRKAKIASNIALANENLDDLTNAVQWIRIASNLIADNKKSEEYSTINWYKVKLLERQQNNPEVLEQMGIEE